MPMTTGESANRFVVGVYFCGSYRLHFYTKYGDAFTAYIDAMRTSGVHVFLARMQWEDCEPTVCSDCKEPVTSPKQITITNDKATHTNCSAAVPESPAFDHFASARVAEAALKKANESARTACEDGE
jgi:hypothetical protein